MQPTFLDNLKVELVKNKWWRTTWKLLAPLRYKTLVLDEVQVVEVPIGFETDFASVPRLPVFWWLTKNLMIRPSVIHDFLYSKKSYDRKTCDSIFLEAGKTENIILPLCVGMFATVRMLGGMKFNQQKEGD